MVFCNIYCKNISYKRHSCYFCCSNGFTRMCGFSSWLAEGEIKQQRNKA